MKILALVLGLSSLLAAMGDIAWLAIGLFVMTLMAWSSDYSDVYAEVDEIERQLREEETRGAA